MSCFQEFYIATFCNFFDFCMQLFSTFRFLHATFCNFFDFCMLLFATFLIFACKIGCFKSFTVKCAHKCNLQRINATFAENKCNFLALLLQQKLALVISCVASCVITYVISWVISCVKSCVIVCVTSCVISCVTVALSVVLWVVLSVVVSDVDKWHNTGNLFIDTGVILNVF